jgi:hypothetical protein
MQMDKEDAVRAVWRAAAAFAITIALGYIFAGVALKYAPW